PRIKRLKAHSYLNRNCMTTRQLQSLAHKHGTPIVVIDHDLIRKNYAEFKKHLPKVQAYYAVKANAEPAIVRTLYKAGASFDVASLPGLCSVMRTSKNFRLRRSQALFGIKLSTPIRPNPKKLCGNLISTSRLSLLQILIK